MKALLSTLVLLLACESHAPARSPDPPMSPLSRCFASAYSAPNVDDAIASCEAQHHGTEWRTKPLPSVSLPDGGTASVRASLDPPLIQAVVRARFDRMRQCYERGLGRDKKLRGQVKVRFAIDLDGKVERATDEKSDLPDDTVVACVIAEYKQLRFPKPVGNGLVNVVYPVVFAPEEEDSK